MNQLHFDTVPLVVPDGIIDVAAFCRAATPATWAMRHMNAWRM